LLHWKLHDSLVSYFVVMPEDGRTSNKLDGKIAIFQTDLNRYAVPYQVIAASVMVMAHSSRVIIPTKSEDVLE